MDGVYLAAQTAPLTTQSFSVWVGAKATFQDSKCDYFRSGWPGMNKQPPTAAV